MMDEKSNNLTDVDFYQQACSYFYYHAEQRTTMINYFIAVFGAGLALYGSLIEKYPFGSTLVAVFLLIVAILFHCIDLRNRFDVKQSQNVISQFEKSYKIDKIKSRNEFAYGVFSNEDNTFKYYGYKKRRQINGYEELRKLYKQSLKDSSYTEEYNKKFNEFYKVNKNYISKDELISTLSNRSIITLSFSIKMLYYSCMTISVLAILFSIYRDFFLSLIK